MTAPSAAPAMSRSVAATVALVIALVMLVAGLGRFGIWQPSEVRIADAARGETQTTATTAPTAHDVPSRPPLQFEMVRLGFHHVSPTESGGRLPTALLALLATMALVLAVMSASDARTGLFTGVAYVTMPLVFMNARQMFGGGVAQSTFTLFLAAGIYALWGRPPPAGSLTAVWRYGRWALLAVFVLAVRGAGWMLGVVPVALGLGLAVLVRWRDETRSARAASLVLAIAGAALGLVAAMAMVHGPLTAYNAWTGFGPDATAPGPLPTYDALIEQIGHACFPWTGILVFGMARLVMPPTMRWGYDTNEVDATLVDDDDAWRETGMRMGAALVAIVAFGFQEFSFQFYGPSPFIAAAPLAIAVAITLRDAERDRMQWRIVTAGAVFITCIVVRDFALFPKQAYAALGLADGGPTFPTGFTGNFGDYLKTHHGLAGAMWNVVAGEPAPTEAYFIVYLFLMILGALCPLFLGAGRVAIISPARPLNWVPEVEHQAHTELLGDYDHEPGGHRVPAWVFVPLFFSLFLLPGISWPFAVAFLVVVLRRSGRLDFEWQAYFSGDWALANLRWFVIGISLLDMIIFGAVSLSPRLNTVVRNVCLGFAAAPIAIVVAIYAVIALWDFFAWLGQPRGVFARVFGSRVALVPLTALVVSAIIAHRYIPALSEHLSPRGVWAVLRQVRQPGEPVARFGGPPGDRATRYYANFDVQDIQGEGEAVDWLRQTSPTHYLIVASDVFPSLNRAYRRTFGEGTARQNVPVVDATNSNLYVAASNPHGTSRNPLDSIVMSVDSDTGRDQHWHPHGVFENGHTTPQPAVFDNAIEYLGYNLDSGGQAFVPAGGTFRIVYHFHVLREVPGNHQVFVHVDGQCPRINGDHEPGGGHYPLRYWLQGDYVHDEERIQIPGYCRGGTYTVYIGFFQGDDRMRVTGGDHDHENRVVAARIVVR